MSSAERPNIAAASVNLRSVNLSHGPENGPARTEKDATHTLADDGTLDTVIECGNCGERQRYASDTLGDDPFETHEAFIEWAIADAEDVHDCPHAGPVTLDDIGPPTDTGTIRVRVFDSHEKDGPVSAPVTAEDLTRRYRIYVGESTREDVQPLTVAAIANATIIENVTGVWKGGAETCTIVEIIGDASHAFESTVHTLAAALRDHLTQECVLLTVEDVKGELI